MRYHHILLDLDGTVLESHYSILGAMAYAGEKMGVTVDLDKTWQFIGPPIWEYGVKWQGMSREDAETLQNHYLDYLNDEGWKLDKLYEGIPELIDSLRAAGARVYACTSKPTGLSRRICGRLELPLDGVWGYEPGVASKADTIRALMAAEGADPASCIMVGDSEKDVNCARACSVDSIGVLYGYGRPEDILAAGPTYAAHSVEELKEILL